MARLGGYGSNHVRIAALIRAKKNAESIDDLLQDDAVAAVFAPRKDKLSGDPIWTKAWHEFTDLKKGQSFRCKIIKTKRVKDPVTERWLWTTQWARHQKRFMSLRISEFHAAVLKWEPYLKWKQSYLLKNKRLPQTWDVGEKRLYKEKCFCIDTQEDIRKCGCQYHLKMEQLVTGLKRWRRAIRPHIAEFDPGHQCESCKVFDDYLQPLTSLHEFGNHLCPCSRHASGDRHLQCAKGSCSECGRPSLIECEVEDQVCGKQEVKFKWLRPIKIGNRNEVEWAWETKPYVEFKKLLLSYYSDTYRLHNWVYKNQQRMRLENRARLQPGDVILEFDYAAKATQFQQDCMPCSAGRQTSNFVVFAHFNPVLDDAGNNVTDNTEVFTFHSNCVKQDTHSIRRALTHVIDNLIARGFHKNVAHLWADGAGSQNKGRKSFRQLSELSFEKSIRIIVNFACSCHFGGPWDTEGGRQTRAVRNFLQNERDKEKGETVLDAGDNVLLLRRILNKAGDPEPPVTQQKMWRPIISQTQTVVTSTTPTTVRKQKPKRQARGRTVTELEDDNTDPRYCIERRHIWRMEPCDCHRTCSCPSDGRLTYIRDVDYDCSLIEGTLSTYCFMFDKKPMCSSVRQYSCYCRWCARGRFDKCVNIDTVRHQPHNPVLPSHAGFKKWRDQGWRSVTQVVKSTPDRAVTRVVTQSLESAKVYISKLPLGTVIAVRSIVNDNSVFWLASLNSKVYPAPKSEPSIDVKKGELIIKIVWFDRCNDNTYKYVRLNDLAHVSVSSVVVTKSKITWQRTTANRYYLGENTHNKLKDIVENMSTL